MNYLEKVCYGLINLYSGELKEFSSRELDQCYEELLVAQDKFKKLLRLDLSEKIQPLIEANVYEYNCRKGLLC